MMRDTRNGFVALVALMVQYLAANETGQTAGARFDPLLQLRASIPEISKCRQLIVVTTEDWNAISATIQLSRREGRIPFFKGVNVEGFIVRLVGLPAGANDAYPLECEGTDGTVMRLTSLALPSIILIRDARSRSNPT
jgi:hypothetical protein